MNDQLRSALQRLGITHPAAVMIDGTQTDGLGDAITVTSPIDGQPIAQFAGATAVQAQLAVAESTCAFAAWRVVPAPRRGELVRRFGEALRAHKEDLATVVSYEAGKIFQESLGEVQEMIDICDFAVGLSRQL